MKSTTPLPIDEVPISARSRHELAAASCRRTVSATAETCLQRRHVCDVAAGACVHPVRLD
jgi:hypothetical protein